MTNFETFIETFKKNVLENSTHFISAILILIIGFWLIGRIVRISDKLMTKREVEPSLRYFLKTLMRIALKIMLIFTVLNHAGVNTTSFIAALGAAGLAIGLALQGSLSNFAGGALILFFKPFKVGDFIKAQGETGEVMEIQIFVTKIKTPEGRMAIIPNGALANGNIINFTLLGTSRVDVKIGIDYNADIQKARNLLVSIMLSNEKIVQEPTPKVLVSDLAESSVNLIVRCWTHPDNYWDVYFDIVEKAKETLQKEGIVIPYPHREVKIIN